MKKQLEKEYLKRSNSSDQPARAVVKSIAASPELIAARAYDIWLSRGCDIGREQEDWFQAEQELLKK